MIHINGEDVDAAGKTLNDYLNENGFSPESIAVECNETIIPKERYSDFILKDGDTVEIVSFVGGGK